jgi:hypothetical protein
LADQNSISWNRLASWLLRRRIHAEYAKQSLRAGDLAEAPDRFRKASGPHAGWKVHAINAALRIAPRFTSDVYRLRTRCQAGSERVAH